MLYFISRDCKYSIHVYVYSRTTCGQEIKYLSIYPHNKPAELGTPTIAATVRVGRHDTRRSGRLPERVEYVLNKRVALVRVVAGHIFLYPWKCGR